MWITFLFFKNNFLAQFENKNIKNIFLQDKPQKMFFIFLFSWHKKIPFDLTPGIFYAAARPAEAISKTNVYVSANRRSRGST
jgi:hypothetical protein